MVGDPDAVVRRLCPKSRSRICRWPLVVALLVVGVTGCGGSGSTSSSSAGSSSAANVTIAHRFAAYIGAWNDASGSWLRAYKSGKRNAFLQVQSRDTNQMRIALAHVENEARHITGSNGTLARRVADATARETAAIVEIDNAVIKNDPSAARRGLNDLVKAAEQKRKLG